MHLSRQRKPIARRFSLGGHGNSYGEAGSEDAPENVQKPYRHFLLKKPSPRVKLQALKALSTLRLRGNEHTHDQSGHGSQPEEYLTSSDSVHRQQVKADKNTPRAQDSPSRESVFIGDNADLAHMIGCLTRYALEDWALVLEVCNRASLNKSNAKEAVRALRGEFKYGKPPAQLSAARLWAIMLRNSSHVFVLQCTSGGFLGTIEHLLRSAQTPPVVRERLLDVVAAAAYASGSDKADRNRGFKGLWRRVKPPNKPNEGVPFDKDDAMFNPPESRRPSGHPVGDRAVGALSGPQDQQLEQDSFPSQLDDPVPIEISPVTTSPPRYSSLFPGDPQIDQENSKHSDSSKEQRTSESDN